MIESPPDNRAPRIALSTDVGEGFGHWDIADDEALLGIVTNANVACGFHAGDPDIMRRTCAIAADNAVLIGAQVSYRDLVGFGRRYVAVPRVSLTNDLIYQMGALEAFAKAAGTRVSYVRAHGALYNVSASDAEHASAIVDSVILYDRTLPLFCQPGSLVWNLAREAGITVVAEAFVDRSYTADGLLLPRTDPGAMVLDPDVAAERAVRMVLDHQVTAVNGDEVTIHPQTLLVHCDTPGAVEIASATRQALSEAGVRLDPQPW